MSTIFRVFLPKIRRGPRTKENIGDDRKQHAVHHQLKQLVKGAEADVITDPGEHQPARPVLSADHKHAAKNREQPQQANPNNLKGRMRPELGDMVGKADDAGGYEDATNDGD